jgi:hypothetical protein
MKLYDLIRVQHLPVALETPRQFFTGPYNLFKITSAWFGYAAKRGPVGR